MAAEAFVTKEVDVTVRSRTTRPRRFAALGTLLAPVAAVAALAVSAPGAPLAAASCCSGEHFPEAKLIRR